jgi:hypothetical protein
MMFFSKTVGLTNNNHMPKSIKIPSIFAWSATRRRRRSLRPSLPAHPRTARLRQKPRPSITACTVGRFGMLQLANVIRFKGQPMETPKMMRHHGPQLSGLLV